MLEGKKSLRNRAKAIRDGIDKNFHEDFSKVICEKVITLVEYKNAKCVMAYYPYNSEVDVKCIIKDCIKNKTLCLPKVNLKENEMIPLIINDLKNLQKGAYSIKEPNESCVQAHLSAIDLVIIPMVAFDDKLTRLGYGGGYYDRFLPKINDVYKIGVAFQEQKFNQIPKEKFDITPDIIVTENKIYRKGY